MAGYTRSIQTGPAGQTWTNDTPRVAYQFHVAGINTCGICYQYSEAISNGPWPIPLHHGCRCRQSAVAPGAEAPRAFTDFREDVAALPHDQQVAVIGASAYKLLEAGVIKWSDVVTESRVRTLREVVSLKGLSVQRMTAAGVRPRLAEAAHASVNTPAHIAADEARRAGLVRLQAAGLKQEAIVAELSARIAARVSVAEGATYTTKAGEVLRGIKAHRMPGAGGSNAAELAKLLGQYLAAKRAAKPKPKPAEEPAATTPIKVETAADREAFRGDVLAAAGRAESWRDTGKVFLHHAHEELIKLPRYADLSLAEFKRLLLADPEMRAMLTRADLIQAMDPADVAASNAEYKLGKTVAAEFNFIKLPRAHAPAVAAGPGTMGGPQTTPADSDIARRIRQSPAWEKVQAIGSIGSAVAKHGAEVDRLLDHQGKLLGELAGSSNAELKAALAETSRALEAAQAGYRIAAGEAAGRAARRLAPPPDAAKVAWTHDVQIEDPSLHADLDKARKFVEGLVARGNGPAAIALKWRGIDADEEQRSFAAVGGKLTFLGAGSGPSAAIHEWGHHLETELPGASQACREFLEHRVKDEPFRPMNELAKSQAFGAHEVGREDEFGRAFGGLAGYVGKKCSPGSSEVLSMGVEKLYQDAAGFAHADPEYASLIIGILHGDIR